MNVAKMARMAQLAECVPNFSEGRDASKIDAIVAAIRTVPDVLLLDRSSDTDHNRSVLTLAGTPDALREAAVRAVGKAAELIDLRKHAGAHPRIGATDVVPFVPVEGVTLEECVSIAHRVGREIWDRHKIPIYFYEAAATHLGRVNLETHRKGQFEGLLADIERETGRAPDIGERRLHPSAGAVAVGARKFLIAYNINLNTPDTSIAKDIARKVRTSGGGLPCVKAMGVDLSSRGMAQVSMNLTDFERTSLRAVFDAVKSEAAHRGVTIAASEIIGLVPKRAFDSCSPSYFQLENFSPSQVFENRLQAALEES